MRIVKHRKALAAIVAAAAVTASVLVACGKDGSILSGVPGAGTQAATDVEVFLELAKAPALYEPVEVTVTVTAKKPDRSPVEVWLELPPTAAFINGQMWWRGDLPEGQSHQFKATVAFVVEEGAALAANAVFSKPEALLGTDSVRHRTSVWVTEGGGEAKPPGPSAPTATRGARSYGPARHPLDGSTLLNATDKPRLFVVQRNSGLDELQKLGLVPDDPSGRWRGKVFDFTGILDTDFEEIGVIIALYDRQRPTTGYHIAVMGEAGGFRARQMLGQQTVFRVGEQPPTGPEPVILDILATAPRPDWPVETRAVSPYQLRLISYRSSQGATQIFLRVNGGDVGSVIVDPTGVTPALTEVSLPPFAETAIP